MVGRVHAWLEPRPLVGDLALALVLLAFALSAPRGVDTAAIVASVLLLAPLALRRRAPVAAFAAVMVACAAELLLSDRILVATIAALIALYSLVEYAPRRVAALGCCVALLGSVPFMLRYDSVSDAGFLLSELVVLVHLALAVALGDYMHSRARARENERETLRQRAQALAVERDQRAALATAAERARIASELHDIVAHSLSVVIAQADGGRYAAASDPAAAAAALRTIAVTAREAQAEMRRTLGLLAQPNDAPSRPQPDLGELPELVARMRSAGLRVELVEEGTARPLAPAAGLAAYRVVQEGLTNVLKHAGRDAAATVVVRWERAAVTLVVRDDGAGLAAPADSRGDAGGAGRGIAGMRGRVEPRGGTLSAGPHPDGGFELRATIPTEESRLMERTA